MSLNLLMNYHFIIKFFILLFVYMDFLLIVLNCLHKYSFWTCGKSYEKILNYSQKMKLWLLILAKHYFLYMCCKFCDDRTIYRSNITKGGMHLVLKHDQFFSLNSKNVFCRSWIHVKFHRNFAINFLVFSDVVTSYALFL